MPRTPSRPLALLVALLLATTVGAQRPALSKLSPWLRQLLRPMPAVAPTALSRPSAAAVAPPSAVVHAFVRLACDADTLALADHGCRSLAACGTLHVASIPLPQLAALSRDNRILRIEATPSRHILTDSMATYLNATDAYTGLGLPQAYTGRGVVVGIVDIGFDLTHPTFYSRDTTEYRIRRFWDQLSADTVGSAFPVGRDYTTPDDILALAHSRDGLDFSHGTYTLGIAAGSGYDSPYRGIAPESDLCLVANAVSDNRRYVDSADVYKYTFATDVLAFKYIFDYADAVGKPCVASLSEGSMQDLYGYDQLFYAMLDSITGPGHIIVAAAGNEGATRSYLHKPRGKDSAGTFLRSASPSMTVVLRSADPFTVRLVAYGDTPDTLLIPVADVLNAPDSALVTVTPHYFAVAEAYPSSYDPDDLCIDLTVTAPQSLGYKPRISLELLGTQADVELWRVDGLLTVYSENPLLDDSESTHNIHSPSSAPCVVSVGATTYRDHIVNQQGDTIVYWRGSGGILAPFSSVGPTMDGRIKPDCVAPGNNIISSYSSYFLEHHPEASDLRWTVGTTTFHGRHYGWNSNSGTSASTPAVAGAVALWLQACPTLTPDDVLGILRRTCVAPVDTLSYPNCYYGYGLVDVYAGLLDVLRLSSVNDLSTRPTSARLTLAPGSLSIQLPTAAEQAFIVRIFDISGRSVHTATIPAGTAIARLPLPTLPAGIYAVNLEHTSPAPGSTLIRIP